MKQVKLYFFLTLLPLCACSQESSKTESSPVNQPEIEQPYAEWTVLAKGIEYREISAPDSSILGDSKLSILRLEPEFLEFVMLNSTQHNKKRFTAPQWADSFKLQIVMNAGMYDLANGLIHRGYMKNGNHFNNRELNPAYNSMIVFQPKDTTHANFDIVDLKCTDWTSIHRKYNCYAQGMRMIDCHGEPLSWNKKKQSCSMLVAAKDDKNRIYFIFSRSPYTHNQMIAFMGAFPDKIHSAIYLEGGPETSLYIDLGDHCIEKIGSYVSQTYAHDRNADFWELPNVIGIRVK
jgi:hypothetical protein